MLKTMQGLTPTISIIVPDTVDLTEANVYVSFKQGSKLLKLTDGFDVSAHQVDVYLTQEDTLQFSAGTVEIQVNWVYSSGQRGATKPVNLSVSSNHLLEVLA
jgi:hypothetical protein